MATKYTRDPMYDSERGPYRRLGPTRRSIASIPSKQRAVFLYIAVCVAIFFFTVLQISLRPADPFAGQPVMQANAEVVDKRIVGTDKDAPLYRVWVRVDGGHGSREGVIGADDVSHELFGNLAVGEPAMVRYQVSRDGKQASVHIRPDQ